MKKILIIMIMLISVISCELFDAKTWDEAEEWAKERGRECYKERGYYYCEDTKYEIKPAYKISRKNKKLWRLGKRLSERSEFDVFPP